MLELILFQEFVLDLDNNPNFILGDCKDDKDDSYGKG